MGRYRSAASAALTAALAVFLRASLAVAEPDADFRAAHDALLAHSDLQFDLTSAVIEPPPNIAWLAKLLKFLAPTIRVIFWVLVAAVVAFILYFIVRELLAVRFAARRREVDAGPVVQDYRPAEAHARVLLSEADRLAAEGRYAEAVRHLLHRSIQDIEEHRPGGLSRALTSREIAIHPALSVRSRAPFVAIAQVVERGFFGGRSLGADDFARCRDAYARFALPEGEA